MDRLGWWGMMKLDDDGMDGSFAGGENETEDGSYCINKRDISNDERN